MKTSAVGIRCRGIHQLIWFATAFIVTLGLPLLGRSQTPGLLWSTNLGARVFAADEQTNVYAQAGTTVIKLNGSGVPLQTNTMSGDSGLAQRDSEGNLFYAAARPGTPIPPSVAYTNPPFYLLKFDAAGTLLWSNFFGFTGSTRGVGIESVAIDSGGNCYAVEGYGLSSTTRRHRVQKFNSQGSNVLSVDLGLTGYSSVALGPVSTTNVHYTRFFDGGLPGASFERFDENGVITPINGWNYPSYFYGVVANSFGEIYSVSGYPSSSGQLVKRTAVGTLVWSKGISGSVAPIGSDKYDGVHLSNSSGPLSRYNNEGDLEWTLNLSSRCTAMVSDTNGNRFISTFDGSVIRLGDELLLAPVVTNPPVGKITFSGSNHVFSVGATGFGPLRYYWLQNGIPLPGKTNVTLNLTTLNSTQTGNYSVIVSNHLGSVTSAPALLTVKGVAVFLGTQMLTNGTYNFLTPPMLTIATAFTNGSRFYTTDGSAPTFAGTFYTAPFQVSTSATIRALGYSADFSQSEEADAVNIVLPPSFALSVAPSPGGTVALNPAGGLYLSNTIVTLTATPTNGWSFLYWAGDAFGVTPSVNVTVDAAKSVQAVFGTTLATTTAGNGQVVVHPAGGTYPYGSTVRLTAVPQAGSYFGVWGNAASGNANPLYFTVTNPTPTVSSLFVPLGANQAALTVLINGPGTVQVSPAGNVFNTNQSVSITATPLAGQGFLNWSGDASGTQNPVSVALTQSRVVTANFTNWPVLVADGMTAQGFRLSVQSGPGLVYQIQASANLRTWTAVGVVTNTSGDTLFTDPSGTNLPVRFYRGTSWP